MDDRNADCKALFAQLSEFLDAELPAETCEQIQAHIAGCPPCVEFVDSLKRSIALCRAYEASAAPAPLREEAREELLSSYHHMLAARKRA